MSDVVAVGTTGCGRKSSPVCEYRVFSVGEYTGAVGEYAGDVGDKGAVGVLGRCSSTSDTGTVSLLVGPVDDGVLHPLHLKLVHLHVNDSMRHEI